MMNKKAIAAFAAGATLLAGFAMATPAFAETAPKQETCKVDAAKLDAAKVKAAQKLAAELTAKAALDEANAKVDTANTQLAKVKGLKKTLDDATTEYNKTTAGDTKDNYSKKDKDKLEKAKNDANDAYTKGLRGAETALGKTANDFADVDAVKTELRTLQGKAADAKDAYDQAVADRKAADAEVEKLSCTPAKPQDPQNTPVNPPAQTADPSKSAASAELMRTQVVFAEADAANKDAQAKYVKAKADFEAAKTQMAALDAQVKSAADREEALRVAGKTDTDAYKAAVIDLKAAQAKANAYNKHEFADALKNYQEKSNKALLAATAYNTALVNYRAAYNKAVEVEASAVKGFADPNTLNPVSTDFPAAPAVAKAEAKKVEAKAEAKTQAAAGKSAAAKGELATKGGKGHGKSGEKLGNAGVGVALTALAASMLAGMGAAVRKMRH